MRNILMILAIIVIGMDGYAFNGKYEEVMRKNITALYAAKNVEEFQQVINTLDRVGATEADKWEPYYYGAYGYTMMSMRMSELKGKDQALDEAQSRLDKAIALSKSNSEMLTMQGFIYMMRLAADPATRGQQYAGQSFEAFNKAVELDSINPRALVMRARMKYGTAQFFGSGTEEACGEAQQALEMFDDKKADESSIAPAWGKGHAVSMLNECNKDEKKD